VRRVWLIGGAAAVVVVLALVLLFEGGSSVPPVRRLIPAAGNGIASYDPYGYAPSKRLVFQQRAAAGVAHLLYAHSPGGVIQTAQRVNALRPMIEQAAKAGKVDPDLLEAIVFLESGGVPTAQASPSLQGAVGLTQILAQTGTQLLGMHIDLKASARLGRQIARTRSPARRRRLFAQRARADERFDPAKSLAATVRYLNFARSKLSNRDDLAVESYHMGVGNLQNALAAYGEGDIPYAQLYFDSSPLRHAKAWNILSSLGDQSSTYLWKVLAAKEIMRQWRANPQRLFNRAVLQVEKNSAEDVMHPPSSTTAFADPKALKLAEQQGVIQPLNARLLARHGLRIDPGMGELAKKVSATPALYRGLRPEALALALYLGTGVQEISRAGPLDMTSSVRDKKYQQVLAAEDIEATHAFSQHTSGYAFDIARDYRSRAQAEAFQFMLDRLTELHLIAWVREPGAIHVTVSSAARALVPIIGLRPQQLRRAVP
jgi:Transglycosylase SLT domain